MPRARAIPADLRLFYISRPPPTLPTGITVQSYFPSLEVLFPSLVDTPGGSPTLAASELAIDISGDGSATVENQFTKARRRVPIWIRQMHLLEPVEVMAGEYVLPADGALPASRGAWQRALRKLNDPYNEAYTDAVAAAMASRLVEAGRSPHFCRFYGTFNGRVPEYTYNITDDMGDIEEEKWFAEGLQNGSVRITAYDPWNPEICAPLTRPYEDVRRKLDAAAEELSISDEGSDEGSSEGSSDESTEEDLSSGPSVTSATNDSDISDLEEADVEASGEAAVVRPRLRLERMNGGSSGSSGGSDDSEEDDVEYRATMTNFPVQMTVLERCDGTMDDLMEDEDDEEATDDMRETKEERWTSWVFQVIAGLTTAQQAYDLIHNDLHTNNVMWTGTGETHLYYHVKGGQGGDRFYRVPTYGRIMKIIDFGRATFRPTAAANDNRLWFPDAYAPGADAAGQYNCGPYFEQGQPKVQPNKSFDLCRLAVAILETLWPTPEGVPETKQPRRVLTREPGHVQSETVSPLWNLLWLWLTDREGRNVLRRPDGRERYPNFDLYCAISRDVQNAVPSQQLTLPLFDSRFRCRRRDIPADAPIYKLQATHAASR
jgi:hypothetical protein